MPDTTIDLTSLTLAKGGHDTRDDGMCLMEAVAWVAGEKHSDHPACASPILGMFGRSLNDVLPDGKRQRLKVLVPAIVGTAGDGHDQARGLMAADWLIRVYTPTWLRAAGLEAEAVSLEVLPRQASWDDMEAAVPVIRAARDAAGAAARDAAWDAAWAAARDAAWDAAAAAAWDAAAAAARDAAWAAAWDAAWAAARDAAGAAAGAAAWDAARSALHPTVDALQDSAIDLYRRMIRPEATS